MSLKYTLLSALLFSVFSSTSISAAPSLVPSDAFNLRIVKATATDVTVTPQVKTFAHNWFAGRFSGLATGQETTIRVDMEGNNTVGNQANVGKWRGLRPLYTYADPMRYETYVSYVRNSQGTWVSSNPFSEGAAKLAGNGPVPIQNVMPSTLAPEFLSSDGTAWSPWHEIETATPASKNTFVIRHTFRAPAASVVMRVPFTHTYWTQFIERLQAAQMPGVHVDEIGETAAKRKLWCVRIEDPTGTAPTDDLKTIVVFAREHATEHATSWAVQGLLVSLLSDALAVEEMRLKVRWLLVPLEDPDGANMSRFDGLTDRWNDPRNNTRLQEVLAYSAYFRDFVDKGNTLDAAVSIHNVEANEAPNFMTPFTQDLYRSATVKFNKELFAAFKEAGYTVARPEPSGSGVMSARLYGWLALQFGTMDMAYEVNDRDPENRLSLLQLQNMGAILGEQLGKWMRSAEGDKRHQAAQQALGQRAKRREAYYAKEGKADNKEAQQFNLLIKGF